MLAEARLDRAFSQCDEMGVAHLWLILLEACTAPRTPASDTACEHAVAWLVARGGALRHTISCFEELHSSVQRAPGAQYAWATTGRRDEQNDDWWHAPLVRRVSPKWVPRFKFHA